MKPFWAAVFLSFIALSALAQSASPYVGEQGVALDAPYVATPAAVVHAMLALARVDATDVVYDLGSGDGRLVIAAVRDFGAKQAVGVDLDPARVADSRRNADHAGISGRAIFHEGDLFRFDFSAASVVTLYLLPEMLTRLRPSLLKLKPGTRIVSHSFSLGDWEADMFQHLGARTIYLWIVPADVAGTWYFRVGDITYSADITQAFQHIAGSVRVIGALPGAPLPLERATLSGDTVAFQAGLPTGEMLIFRGGVVGDTILAEVTNGGSSVTTTAKRIR
jgi:SAM-dependent methyltransferase